MVAPVAEMKGGDAIRIGVRAVLTVVVMSALMHATGPALLEFALPLVAAELRALDDAFQDHSLSVDAAGGEMQVRVKARARPAFVIGGRAIETGAGSRASIATLAAHAYQPFVLALAVACAWPAPARRIRVARILFALAFAALVVLADLPFVLAAELWEIMRDAAAPGETSWLVAWKTFLEGGGRLCLGLATGAAAACIAARRDRGGA